MARMRRWRDIALHGHSVTTIERLINETTVMLPRPVRIESILSTGWSNINLMARSDSRRVIIKLPGIRTACLYRKYESLFDITLALSEQDICPKPIEVGSLDDVSRTPFVIMEYEHGRIPEKIECLRPEEITAIATTLTKFRNCRPPYVNTYHRPSDYLRAILAQLEEATRQTSSRAGLYVQRLTSGCTGMGAYLDATCEWGPLRMVHGDLQEANILLLPHGQAKLLDFESCFMGEPAFDLAYIVCQRPGLNPEAAPPSLSSMDESARARDLIPLALMSVICWSISYLSWSERGCIERIIEQQHPPAEVLDYIEEKLRHIERLSMRWCPS